MIIKDTIINLIKENAYVSAPVTEKSNLYTDLGFNSLSFMSLLTEIEEAFAIIFDISEMEKCLQVGRIITTVENKLRERGDGAY